ncbi:hypothetical protein HYDPIDRAFT_154792 [Hydnomerulius pinastri MD-312]|uniref:RING-type domain-containing protein n=1 Tax=Hydnomerulius pinastri MD-312 TaxID=994086 RepID=A0A0C9W0P8_9AGAM|nr:hypothetical protein HYDPIDRAFT_154792 [Hydnomerulius pinastri MD-312]
MEIGMDSAPIIHQTESLRRKPSYYWPEVVDHSYGQWKSKNEFRPALNLNTLISLLDPKKQGEVSDADGDDQDDVEEPPASSEDDAYGVGDKRQLSSSSSRPQKRIRLDDDPDADFHASDEEEIGDGEGIIDPDDQQIYPSFWEHFRDVISEPSFSSDVSFLNVHNFSIESRYTTFTPDSGENATHYANARSARKWGWVNQEKRLLTLLEARRKDPSLSNSIPLGRIYLLNYLTRLLALSSPPADPDCPFPETIKEVSENWLCLLPDVPWPDGFSSEDLASLDISSPDGAHADFITACSVLQAKCSPSRLKVEMGMTLEVLPKGSFDPTKGEMGFVLKVGVEISLPVPTIYTPFEGGSSQRRINELENLQRRLMSWLSRTPLFPAPSSPNEANTEESTIPFFLSTLRPAPPLPPGVSYELIQPDALQATLLPFQRRSVCWMLEREGKRVTADGFVASIGESSTDTREVEMPPFWTRIQLAGQKHFYNRLTSAVSPSLPEWHRALGGILAEEPGLGKTMECISLMLLNPAPERKPTNKKWDPGAQLYVGEIKTTLIITPPPLAPQWADELATYAPDLKVLIYEGWTKVGVPVLDEDAVRVKNGGAKQKGKGKRKDEEMEDVGTPASGSNGTLTPNDAPLTWPSYINQYDVCITTYPILRSDTSVARAPPSRSRRADVEYGLEERVRQRSPLVAVEWYRVIMDEVQAMGGGKSEEMVSLIPRVSSFAVSGTPARAQVADLIRVLRFLRVDDLVAPARMWKRLVGRGCRELFAELFGGAGVRTLKAAVKDELTIPEQQRYLVSIELGRVERHVYDQAVEDALVELELDARGVAAYEGWQVDAGVLRNVLRRLRGICTHPQVGQLQRPGDKLNKTNALKSIGDVLEMMRDQNWRNLMDDRKAKIQAHVRLAQLQQHREADLDRYQRALEYLLTAQTEANDLIAEIQGAIAAHHEKGETLKKEAEALRESRTLPAANTDPTGADQGKGKQKESTRDLTPFTDSPSEEDEDDIEDRGLPKTPLGEEHRIKRGALQARLRECLIVLHRVKFLMGDVYHVLGAMHGEKEDEAYAGAEAMRKALLKTTEESANKAMRRLRADATSRGVNERALQIALPFLAGGGIRSTDLFDEANEIIEDSLNEQSALLWQWRTKIIDLLTQKLTSAGEQADGEEYSRTLDTQGEAEVYLQAYAALLADRREAIAAERTLLAAHDAREKKTRKTKAALAAAQLEPNDDLEIPEDIDVQPQHEVLHKKLMEERKEIHVLSSGRALKSIMVDLAGVAAGVRKDTDPEKTIARDGAASLRALITSQVGIMDKLDADLAQLRKVFNDRIVYFRQLQEISDTVAEVIWDGSVDDAMEATKTEQTDLGNKINTGRARQRYLDHLAKNKEDGTMDEDDECCILCRCEFTRGFITQCAHVFCEGCMKAWLARRQRACPVCRVAIDPNQLQRFAVKGDQPPPSKPILANGEVAPTSRREIQYNMINPTLFADIQTMESNGSYGSKIQTLVRHLLYIQLAEPGAKSIVFSAWADSLTIIEHALHHNNIPCLRLDKDRGKGKDSGAKRFRIDPDLQVLLLHGAIARIDRMGQTQATEVFCYYAEDTVEKNILDLAARQGLSLYTKDNSAGSVNVTSFAMDSEKKLIDSPKKGGKNGQSAQKGDFIFKVNDMLAILFPHMFEDIEFLLPQNADQEQSSNSGVRDVVMGYSHINAEAGPSRIAS